MNGPVAGTRTSKVRAAQTVRFPRGLFFVALLAAGSFATMPLAAQEQHVSVGVLGGFSVGTQSNALGDSAYIPPPDSQLVDSYTYNWSKLSTTIFLDAIYGYLDLALGAIVGDITGTETLTGTTHPSPPSSSSRLSVNLGVGAKMPIELTDDITVFPLVGLDIISRPASSGAFFASTFIPLIRIGAGGDFRLNRQLYLRVLLDYSANSYFNFVDIKTGIGIKL